MARTATIPAVLSLALLVGACETASDGGVDAAGGDRDAGGEDAGTPVDGAPGGRDSGGTTEPDAGPEPDPTVFVATTGSDDGPCTRPAPCLTFQRAYEVAAPGAVVEVADGSYASQDMLAVEGKTGPNVIFREAPGARVILEGLGFGTDNESQGPDYITVRGLETAYKGTAPGARNQNGIFIGPGSTYIHLDDMDAGSFHAWLAEHITITGGDYGPCDAVAGAPNVCSNNKLDAASHVTVDGAYIHDLRFDTSCLTVPGADCHWECMYVNGGRNNTIRNSVFTQCALFDIFFTISGPDAAAIGHQGLTVENNWFDAPWTEDLSGGEPARGSGVALAWCSNSPDHGYRDVLVRNNSFNGTGLWGPDPTEVCPFENVSLVGNLMQYQGSCDVRMSYAYNGWSTEYRSGTCADTDVMVESFPYASAVHGEGIDLHLASDSVIDDLVPGSAGCPATDIDGDPRPSGAGCEAGADER